MILVVVAHPDDESLFCGATLAQSSNVHVASLGTGVGARGEVGGELLHAVSIRAEAFRRACHILGAEGSILNVFPDQMADMVPQIKINRAVEDLLHAHEPSLVYTHHVGDLNIDHRRVAEAVLVATRRGPRVRCMTPEFPDRCVGPRWEPNFMQAIDRESLDKKIAACLCYETEMRQYPHPRSEQALRQYGGGEAFMEIR